MSHDARTGRQVLVTDVSLPLDESLEPLAPLTREIALKLNVSAEDLRDLVIVRRALDARLNRPRYVFSVRLVADQKAAERWIEAGIAFPSKSKRHRRWRLESPHRGPRPVVIGAGPAGLFAALTLAEGGMPPVLIDRGLAVEERGKKVSRLYSKGELDSECNVCFGEGGAGTYSDGKLYTRVKDPRVRSFMHQLVSLGADPNILVNARPHLGTDRLVTLLKSIRHRLTQLGVIIRYGCRVDGANIQNGQIKSLRLPNQEVLECSHVVVATGHSARDLMRQLHRDGVPMETTPTAVGFRIEHPQPLIDQIRYGKASGHEALPAADYKLVHGKERPTYSFCMCPGGVVVTTPTLDKQLCINGMSHAARSGRFANSAMVVAVNEADYNNAGHQGVFAGYDFLEAIEGRAFDAGGGKFTAPAARVTDYLSGTVSSTLGPTSYRRGIAPANLHQLMPPEVNRALEESLRQFDRRMRGFITEEAQLIGVETRTSSPVKIPRSAQCEAAGVKGLFPSGEGTGYGGGIASAAVDGVRVADSILELCGAESEETEVW